MGQSLFEGSRTGATQHRGYPVALVYWGILYWLYESYSLSVNILYFHYNKC